MASANFEVPLLLIGLDSPRFLRSEAWCGVAGLGPPPSNQYPRIKHDTVTNWRLSLSPCIQRLRVPSNLSDAHSLTSHDS
ncbi:hypothetical protein AB1N83_000639 [Pleurotus pulmonarius]